MEHGLRSVTWPHPIDQGNVLIFSWSWWQEMGGYDKLMRGSSTLLIENIELGAPIVPLGAGASASYIMRYIALYSHKE